MVKNIEIVKFGSNKLRTKLNWIVERDMYPGSLQEPIIKGRDYAPRNNREIKRAKAKEEKRLARI